MKIIFLDIDGVLNSHMFLQGLTGMTWDSDDQKMIDPAAVVLMNELIARTAAKVVLSSSWRYNHTPADMQRLLEVHGFVGEVIDSTPTAFEDVNVPYGETRQRGHEITTWLEEHTDVTSFVILDDDGDMARLSARLVRTTFQSGLLPEHIDRATVMLRDA